MEITQGLLPVGICDRVVEEVGKSGCHNNHTGKIQSPVATKEGPATRGGCGSDREMRLRGLGIACLLETRSKAQMGRAARPKTCQQTAQLWGVQTTGASLAPVKILLMGMWLNAEGTLQVDGHLGWGADKLKFKL